MILLNPASSAGGGPPEAPHAGCQHSNAVDCPAADLFVAKVSLQSATVDDRGHARGCVARPGGKHRRILEFDALGFDLVRGADATGNLRTFRTSRLPIVCHWGIDPLVGA